MSDGGADLLHQYCTNARTAVIDGQDFATAIDWLERAFADCGDAIAADAAIDGWITNFYTQFLNQVGRGLEARHFFNTRAAAERLALATAGSALDRVLTQPTPIRFADLAFQMWLFRHDYISGEIRSGRLWEPAQCQRMRDLLRPGDLMIDIGANIGWHSLIAAAAVGAEGRVLAFEPDPINHRLLSASAAVNQFVWLEAYALAIGADHAEARLGRPALGNNGQHSLIEAGAEPDSVMVDIVPLDSMAQLIDRPVRFLKMDVEGFEGRAFAGMRGVLASAAAPEYMLVEFSPLLLQRASDSASAFERVMADYGYAAEILHQFNTEEMIEAASLTDLYTKTLASKTSYGAQYDLLFHRLPRAA